MQADELNNELELQRQALIREIIALETVLEQTAPTVELHSLKLKTECICPPIPIRDYDWSAWDDNTYDGPGSPLGRGSTEQAAIQDLLEQLRERKARQLDHGEPQ